MTEKHSKEAANYRDSDGAERCGNCRHFLRGIHRDDGNGCEVVAGTIAPDMVSDYYEAR